jgi:hypothetical protein
VEAVLDHALASQLAEGVDRHLQVLRRFFRIEDRRRGLGDLLHDVADDELRAVRRGFRHAASFTADDGTVLASRQCPALG